MKNKGKIIHVRCYTRERVFVPKVPSFTSSLENQKKNKLTKKSQDLCDLCGCFVWSLQPNRFSFSVFFATKLCCTKFDLKLTHSAFFVLRFLGNQTGVEESEEAGANLE